VEVDEGSPAASQGVPVGAELMWIGESPVRGLDTLGVLNVLRVTKRPLTLLIRPVEGSENSDDDEEEVEDGDGHDHDDDEPSFRASYAGEEALPEGGEGGEGGAWTNDGDAAGAAAPLVGAALGADGSSPGAASSSASGNDASGKAPVGGAPVGGAALAGAQAAYVDSKVACAKLAPAATTPASPASPARPSPVSLTAECGIVSKPGDAALTPNRLEKYRQAKEAQQGGPGGAEAAALPPGVASIPSRSTETPAPPPGAAAASAEELIDAASGAVFRNDEDDAVDDAALAAVDPRLAQTSTPSSSKAPHRSRSFKARLFGSKKKKQQPALQAM
jgi:hypothetical protein